jgi:segregation and condensation protein B
VTGFDDAIVDESVDPVNDNSVDAQADEPTEATSEPGDGPAPEQPSRQPDDPTDDTAGELGGPSQPGQPLDDQPSESSDLAAEPTDLPIAVPDLDDPDRLAAAVEALLFVVESPITVAAIAAVIQRPTGEIETALTRIASSYDQPGRGVELRWIADGVRIYTRPECSDVVEAFLLDGQRSRLSPAALETLAVIAYRQPVTRGRISAIRGVNVDGVVRTLASRGLIVEEGTEGESGAGLYRTTGLFLERMGLQTLDELPSLAPLLPEIDTLETDEL